MEAARLPGNKFFVQVSGRTNEAHHKIIVDFKSVGQTEVSDVEDSDYLLVFCPIASRVGTDISEALEKITEDKPIILVVMHHTFDTEKTLAGSRRLVTDPRVRLTVDYLFYQSDLLSCATNYFAWQEIKVLLRVPFREWPKWIICGVLILILVVLLILVIVSSVEVIMDVLRWEYFLPKFLFSLWGKPLSV